MSFRLIALHMTIISNTHFILDPMQIGKCFLSKFLKSLYPCVIFRHINNLMSSLLFILLSIFIIYWLDKLCKICTIILILILHFRKIIVILLLIIGNSSLIKILKDWRVHFRLFELSPVHFLANLRFIHLLLFFGSLGDIILECLHNISFLALQEALIGRLLNLILLNSSWGFSHKYLLSFLYSCEYFHLLVFFWRALVSIICKFLCIS